MIEYTQLKNNHRHNLCDVIPLPKPYTLLIEPSSTCNFRCRMCFQNAAHDLFKNKRRNMDLDLFESIINQAKAWPGEKFKVLKLCIYGEPLMNRDFPQMLKIAREADISERIETTSNASLLNESIAKAMVTAPLDYLRVSIYSAIPQKHTEITQSTIPMQQIHDNLTMLQKIKRQYNSIRPFVAVKMLNTFNEEENQIFRKRYADVADEIYIDEPHSWVEINDEHFIERLYGDGLGKVKRDMQNRKACPLPFTTMAIRSDGAVAPCCNDWYGGTNLGYVQDKPLFDIWHSQEWYDFCILQLSGRNHENISCRGCSVYKSNHYTKDDIDDISVDDFAKRWEKHAVKQ